MSNLNPTAPVGMNPTPEDPSQPHTHQPNAHYPYPTDHAYAIPPPPPHHHFNYANAPPHHNFNQPLPCSWYPPQGGQFLSHPHPPPGVHGGPSNSLDTAASLVYTGSEHLTPVPFEHRPYWGHHTYPAFPNMLSAGYPAPPSFPLTTNPLNHYHSPSNFPTHNFPPHGFSHPMNSTHGVTSATLQKDTFQPYPVTTSTPAPTPTPMPDPASTDHNATIVNTQTTSTTIIAPVDSLSMSIEPEVNPTINNPTINNPTINAMIEDVEEIVQVPNERDDDWPTIGQLLFQS
ncbi:uncharacterized protein MELLADRAFT_88446 [Melampsora larici-populina 98AG31]|uniref:Uncharacterized protein n=1 Tax=Melampsora larici-populina (strain 98AG31 / pathotype 3-4-7) TaxID=747676 RepID=F4SE61_MELLP|nr:uncharacterized protein MELLADRAFT_88446 [Melampsora larici-populina 98AG31]EGF97063.1 hypothetical protein MELLADRAFT_88446 [Melampsora larici-populina 98AG31]